VSRRIALLVAASLVAAAGVILAVSMRREAPASSAARPRAVDARGADATIARADVDAPAAAIAAEPAPPAAEPDAGAAARDERLAAIATLERSGPGREDWDASAMAIFDAADTGSVEVTSVGCFIAGCAATMTYASRDAYARGLERLQGSAPYRAWTGGKVLTRPELLADGRVVVALVLYRPD
jgi:hypothetical protein